MKTSKKLIAIQLTVIGLGVAIFCYVFFVHDWNHKESCEWYLMPDTTSKKILGEGEIPVCARNLVVQKQNCRLKADLSFVKKHYGKRFKLAEMEVSATGPFPRKVLKIRPCKK